MATTLSQLRRTVANVVSAAGVPCYGHVPERLAPPAAVLLPDTPYVSGIPDESTACGTYRVRLRLVLITARGTNELAADDLDELIVQAVNALDQELDVLNVAEPAEVELNGATYLGTVLQLEQLTEMEIL